MNEEQIKKIALEVAREWGCDRPLEFASLFAATLKRIDAERGKEAVAWVDTLEAAQPRCVTNLDYRSVTEAKLGVEYIPLFLSPTIPEGWAQIPPEKPLPDLMMASYHEAVGWNACRDAMIAAHGERNAD